MARRTTEEAVAQAAPLDTARAAAGGSGSGDPLVGELRRAGLLPLLVLHLLRDGASYGNALMERVAAATGGLVAVNPNTMYPLLRRLEAGGFIAGEWEHPERRSRRFYRVTDAGAAERVRLEAELAPRLDAVAAGVAAIRRELGELMARVTRTTELPGPISAAEDLWYDLRRRVSFVEGFGYVAKVDGPWPQRGSRVVWDSPPKGRGRVAETVEAHEARSGQTVSFEDERLRGTQTTRFAPGGDGQVLVSVTLDWSLKEGNVVSDWVFVRRTMGEALRRTLVKYRIERIADLEDQRTPRPPAP